MNLDDHAEELASDLGVDKEEVRADLENLVEYSVPVEEAKQSLRRKYSDGGDDEAAPASRAVADITTEDSNVSVTATLLTVGKRSIRYQGEDQVIYEGQLADETGRIDFTAWVEFDHETGETLRLDNAGVREWEGEPELNIGDETRVQPADETLDVDYEVGGDADLAELAPGDRGVNVEVTVPEVERKIIDGRDGETEILDGVIADETARLPFTDWDPHESIAAGESVRIENVYVREFRGAPSVNVSEFSTVEPVERTIEAPESAPRYDIGEAVDSGGLFDVEVTGNVVGVRDGSGLIERCPECGRVIQNGQCRSHGEVDGEEDLRTKAILDDGTGTVTVVLDDELTAEVYGGDLDDAREHARDAMDREAVADAIRETLVGREFRARGSLSVDDFGANLDASEFAELTDDPSERAERLLEEVAE